ncbi:MAG: ATP-binding protein, partial [bacterium]
VSMWELQHPPKGRTVGKIKDHLASIYRIYLRSGTLKLIFNGEPLRFDEPAILMAARFDTPQQPPVQWRKHIAFDFGNGQRVHGFAALRETASTAYAGLALFRRNRLIQGSADEPYRPLAIFGHPNSYRYQRLFGELNLEGFEVSHTKDGFRWEEHEEVFLDCLREEIEREPLNLLDQAEGYRAKQSRKNVEATAQKATDHVAYAVEREVAPLLVREAESPANPPPLSAEVPKSQLEASTRTVAITAASQQWEVTIRTTVDPAVGPWLRLGEQSRRQAGAETVRCLTIDVALAHPFTQQFLGANHENLELFLRFGAAIALALVMASAGGGGAPQFALHHINSLLRDALAQP